jgi:membrane protein YdbS with pleckstrin-like domain
VTDPLPPSDLAPPEPVEPRPEPVESPPELSLDATLQPLDPRAVPLWRLSGAISTVLWGGVISVASMVAMFAIEGPRLPVFLGGSALVFLNAVLRIGVVPPIRYRLWRYQLRADQLFLQRGWLVVRHTLIPLVRVQNVDTVQGPVARYFGLWSVVVFTAANAQAIPALSKEQADQLRESIAELARRARDEA